MKYCGIKAVILISTMIFISSCGTTENVAQEAETADNVVSQKQEEVADAIADEISRVSPQPEAGSESEVLITEEKNTTTQEPLSEDKEPSERQDENPLPESGKSESLFTETFPPKTEPDSDKKEDLALQDSLGATDLPQNQDAENEKELLADESSEKVSDEDLLLKNRKDSAPTTDEKNKVNEYQIFEEPEIIVHDIEQEAEEEHLVEEEHLEEPEILIEELPSPTVSEKEQEETTAEEEPSQPQESIVPPLAAEEEVEKDEIEQENSLLESYAEVSPAEEEAAAPLEEEVISEEKAEQIIPSRQSTVQIGQYLDITYPGTGWVYIGENDSSTIFNYFGRKLGSEDTTFALRAKKAGQTVLHFYKNDALTGEFIEDYLEVQVLDEKGTGRVKAPSYAELVPAAPQRRLERENQLAEKDGEGIGQENSDEIKKESDSISETEENAQTQARNIAKEVSAENENTQNMAENNSASKTVTGSMESDIAMDEKESDSKTDSINPQGQEQPKEEKKESAKESKASQLAETPQSSAILPQQDKVKTVIQETDSSTTHINDLAVNRQESKANSPEEKKESFDYTPVSSEGSQPQPEIEEEPSVLPINKTVVNNAVDDSLLEEALKDFDEKKYADALAKAQEYYNTGSKRLDEALYLLGQISESNSTVKDIRFAVDSYDMLVKRFPQSKLWKEAKNRSIYLKRFYIDIR